MYCVCTCLNSTLLGKDCEMLRCEEQWDFERREKEALDVKEEGKTRPSGAIRGTWCLETKGKVHISHCHKRNVHHNIHVWCIRQWSCMWDIQKNSTHANHGIHVHNRRDHSFHLLYNMSACYLHWCSTYTYTLYIPEEILISNSD